MLPFAYSCARLMLYCVLVLASWGTLLVVSVWYPQIFTRVARVALPYSAAGDADYMLVFLHGNGVQARWVECVIHHPTPSGDDYRTKVPWVWFEFKKQRYVYDYERGEFRRYLATIREDLGKLQRRSDTGLDEHVVRTKQELFGANRISIDKPSIAELLFVKLVHPFYIFQIFSIVVWFFKDYTKRHHLVSEGLVGADILLLSGGCTADEASLTGEAVPVNKEPATGAGFITETSAREKHKASFLHAGSTIIRVYESDTQCKGVVVSTGFSTGKGELFRSILFPTQITFEFERDSYRYLVILWAVAIAAFIKRLLDGIHISKTVSETIVDSLDLITVAVPPTLPLVLTSGIGFSMHRLYRRGIFCTDSRRVNSCGQLSCFCFDKTGTLTKEHLTFAGVAITEKFSLSVQPTQTSSPSKFKLGMATCHGLSEYGGAFQGYSLDLAMFRASGYSMEFFPIPPYEQYIAVVTAPDETKHGIISRFAFDATCQRSSAVVEEIDTGKRFVFVKGSPEAVSAISTTTPPDLKHKTLAYSTDGYYCIGFGVKELNPNAPIDVNNRDEVESAVEFEGLALFKNELKPETKSMLDELYVADIDVRVITGDNALTAVHVCRELEMKMKSKVAVVDVDELAGGTVFVSVDDVKKSEVVQWTSFNSTNMDEVLAEFDLAITGAALDKLQRDCGDETVRRIIQQTPVFARVRPQQKAWIVEQLISLGLVVGMCGDGTNDCGALKAAHVGLALSSAEASIVAPFTSKAKAILDVPVLIREGRCALTTSFLGFKYMVLYPIIQLGMASVLAQIGTWADIDLQLTDMQYFWDDLTIVLALAMCMLYTGPSGVLSRAKPPTTLFSLEIIASLLGHIVIFAAFFALAFVLMSHETGWYCSIENGLAYVSRVDVTSSNCAVFKDHDLENIKYSYEDTVTWLFAHLQYVAAAAALNVNDPFRLPFYTNLVFTVLLVEELVVNLWLLLDNSDAINDTFQLMPIPSEFRWKLFWLFIAEFVASISWELIATRALPKWRRRRAITEEDKE
ncbi:hypothetical protein ON010_g11471 [Phytophthora cinnamomi]|nr:hypothetical protein ON010_g11471 [Phytophthora cinnamomi]